MSDMKCSGLEMAILGLSMLGAGGSAQAVEPGFYVGAAIGQAQQDVGPTDGIVVSIGGFLGGYLQRVDPDSTRTEQDVTSWNASLGYRPNDYVAAELSYVDFGTAGISEHYTIPVRGVVVAIPLTRNSTSSITGPVVSILGSLPVGAGVELFVRAGYFFADQEIEQRFTGGSLSNTAGDETWLGGGGVSWTFSTRWAVRAEYVRTGELKRNVFVGETDVDQVSLGVVFKL